MYGSNRENIYEKSFASLGNLEPDWICRCSPIADKHRTPSVVQSKAANTDKNFFISFKTSNKLNSLFQIETPTTTGYENY